MDTGYPSVLVGPEGGHRPDHITKEETSRQIEQIELARSAHNIHAILDYTQPRYHHNEEHIVTLGESRGAMVGMGLIPFGKKYNREVIYSDYVAPCFAEGIEWHELVNLRGQLPHELGSLALAFAKISTKRLMHLPGTINPRHYSMLHAMHTWKTLSSGQAGAMARLIDKDQPMQITSFKGDLAGQLEIWRDDIFAEHTRVHISEASGGHLTIANANTLKKILGRLAALGEQLKEERSPDELDYSLIHLKDQPAAA